METSTITEKEITNSSQIQKVKYNSETKVLTVTFKGNSTYEYYEVPITVFEELLTSESAGKYLNAKIKQIYKFKFLGNG
jgi:hypothetical protein